MVLCLDDAAMMRLAGQERVLALVPELARLGRYKRGCCGKADNRPQLLLAAKKAIAGLSNDRRSNLKALLGADTIAVRYMEGKHVVETRF
jgi:hypothetical protein